MYTSVTMQTKDRYSYNGFRILNINPNHLPEGDVLSETYIANCKTIVYNNIENLISQLSAQLTSRQKAALRIVGDTVRNQWDFSLMFGVHEFRFEGAGSYRSGIDDDGYAANDPNYPVSITSIDFVSRGGYHNEAGFPTDFNDGFGLYGTMSVVYRDGEIMGVFNRASTLPDKLETYDTVAEGTYSFKVGTHPISGGYKALNIYKLNDFTSAGRTLPTAINKTPGEGITGVNSHRGYKSYRGSEGCQTLFYDSSGGSNDDWTSYIGLFITTETGRFVIKRYITLPSV